MKNNKKCFFRVFSHFCLKDLPFVYMVFNIFLSPNMLDGDDDDDDDDRGGDYDDDHHHHRIPGLRGAVSDMHHGPQRSDLLVYGLGLCNDRQTG